LRDELPLACPRRTRERSDRQWASTFWRVRTHRRPALQTCGTIRPNRVAPDDMDALLELMRDRAGGQSLGVTR